jgi:redox-sensitive bicupin YhaK (pirin superfamily)
MILSERNRDIGGFTVGRLLPFRQKRMIGPFIFVDHMGPATVGTSEPFDIGQHPHIGLSTLTYLLEGEILHKDSVGSHQVISPGDVNWMTAGKGVVHTEKTPEHLIGEEYIIHGYQIWVALPLDSENIDPSFHHIAKDNLPTWKENELNITLVAGQAFSRTSPVPVYSDLYMLHIATGKQEGEFSCNDLYGEFGLCPVMGNASINGKEVSPGEMLVIEECNEDIIRLSPNSTIMVFGGDPYEEKRYIDWNFVHSDRDKIDAAKMAWREREFTMIDSEKSYVPFPDA